MESPIEVVRRFCAAWSDDRAAADLAAFATVLAGYAEGWTGFGIRLIALFDSLAFFLGAPLLAVYGLLLFPHGRVSSRRWWAFAALYGCAFALVDVVGCLDPGGVDGSSLDWGNSRARPRLGRALSV